MFKKIPFDRVSWVTSIFLISLLVLTLTAVPWYLWNYGLDTLTLSLFIFYFFASGLSITFGYHRLFSHISFKAVLPVRLFALIFGAAAFENSVLDWSSDHRRHHKHVDHDDDPYNFKKGFFYAHLGWMLLKLKPAPLMDNVKDLEKDPFIVFQHRWIQTIAVVVSFVIPGLLGWWNNGFEGALGGVLIVGVARVVLVQNMAFSINSFAHCLGKQPYSSASTARDSWITAFLTFGEGYHNFHHTFQHDYRNGVKFWQFDPTKWLIWLLSKIGLVSELRRVPEEKILLAEIREARKQVDAELNSYFTDMSKISSDLLKEYIEKVQTMSDGLVAHCKELQDAAVNRIELSKEIISLRRGEINEVMSYLKQIEVLGKKMQCV